MRPTDNVPHTVGHPDDAKVCEEGARARRAGKVDQDNPYALGSIEHCEWHAGWLRPGMYIGDE